MIRFIIATGKYVVLKMLIRLALTSLLITVCHRINKAQSGVNFPVIRYADVLLLYAEVNEINGAQWRCVQCYKPGE